MRYNVVTKPFSQVNPREVFLCKGNIWEKWGQMTARLKGDDQIFYFHQDEPVRVVEYIAVLQK